MITIFEQLLPLLRYHFLVTTMSEAITSHDEEANIDPSEDEATGWLNQTWTKVGDLLSSLPRMAVPAEDVERIFNPSNTSKRKMERIESKKSILEMMVCLLYTSPSPRD